MHILIHLVLLGLLCMLWDHYAHERRRRLRAEQQAQALQQTIAGQALQITQLRHTIRELQRHPPIRFSPMIRVPLLWRN